MDSHYKLSDDDDSEYDEVDINEKDMERLMALESDMQKNGNVYDKHVEVCLGWIHASYVSCPPFRAGLHFSTLLHGRLAIELIC